MRKIAVPDEGVETFFGAYDENLRHLESLFDVRIKTDGHGLIVEGDPASVDKVERVVDQIGALLRDGYKFAKGEVQTAASLVAVQARPCGLFCCPDHPPDRTKTPGDSEGRQA